MIIFNDCQSNSRILTKLSLIIPVIFLVACKGNDHKTESDVFSF